MKPIDTNHTSLQIYFDYLEDNNFPTEELRNDLVKPIYPYYHDTFRYNFCEVGISIEFVGTDGHHNIEEVGTIGGDEEVVGAFDNGVGGIDTFGDIVGN